MIKLAPSILTADFADLKEEVKKVEENGATYLHLDVMDGHFVPNMSFGAPIVKSIRKITDMTLDVHLMITNPLSYVKSFSDAGADIINFHYECSDNIDEVINEILKNGKKAGITVKPDTDIESIYKYLDRISMVLIMSVYPGFGGQKFMPDMLEKVTKLKDYCLKNNLDIEIEIDGGANMTNVEDIIKSGVNVIVVGSEIYNENGADVNTKKYVSFFNEIEKSLWIF